MNNSIAIIGMSGRFPKSKSLEEFWNHIDLGTELVSRFATEELAENEKQDAEANANYIKAKAFIEDIECFDAPLFNVSDREAECMDPQQRKLLECSWECFEDAGYDPAQFQGLIGVFVCSSLSTYFLKNLMPSLLRSRARTQSESMMILGCDKDFLATKISYKLNLKGSSQTIQTACSSSLVSVHYACQSLLDYDSDMALAGGMSITIPQKHGYFYTEEGINSPTGSCRPFDSDANGTLIGNGGGLILLKRLEDALNDRDAIRAIIRGSAVNNDGRDKVGYTAPSLKGQAAVIRSALVAARAKAESISYIETHGTGTELGDSVEIGALKKVFKDGKPKSCALGSLKGNIGHLDAAAGIAGLIKTVLAINSKRIPKSGNFKTINPLLQLDDHVLYVSHESVPWEKKPRLAGVSSFGIGGTNAHVILEECQSKNACQDQESDQWLLFPISAHTEVAFRSLVLAYIDWIKTSSLPVADVSYTMQLGRKPLRFRKCFIARKIEGLLKSLETCKTFHDSSASEKKEYVWNLSLPKKDFYKHADISDLLKEKFSFAKNRDPADHLFVSHYLFCSTLLELQIIPHLMVAQSFDEYLLALTLSGSLSLDEALRFRKKEEVISTQVKESAIAVENGLIGERVDFRQGMSRQYWKEQPQNQSSVTESLYLFDKPLEYCLMHQIIKAWEHGLNINWSVLYKSKQLSRVPLPTYPFEKHSYWIDPILAAAESQFKPSIQQVKPLKAMDPVEKTLMTFWQKSLKNSSFDQNTSFLDLGGDSLIALEICDDIRQAFLIDFSIRLFLTFPSIAEQAFHIKTLLKERLPTLDEEEAAKILAFMK